MDLSIITVNYNGLPFIRECIESTGNLDAGLSWEMIVVDNDSQDGSLAYLEDIAGQSTSLKLIKSGSNQGFASASNLGAGLARGKYLLFLNPDARFRQRGIYKLIEFYCLKGNTEKIGAVGPRMVNTDGTLQYNARSFPNLGRQFLESSFLYRIRRIPWLSSYFLLWWDHASVREVDWLSGACLFIAKDTFGEAGGFDPSYFMYSEDTDLCLQLARKGYHNYYYPFWEVIHADSGIASRNRSLRMSQIWESRTIYFKKNFNWCYSKAASILFGWGILNRTILAFVLGQIPKAREWGRVFINYFG